jgi:hypothetical protein
VIQIEEVAVLVAEGQPGVAGVLVERVVLVARAARQPNEKLRGRDVCNPQIRVHRVGLRALLHLECHALGRVLVGKAHLL